MKSILKLWIKNETLLTIWLLWLILSGIILSLPPKNFIFSCVSLLHKEWLYKTLLELLLLSLGLLLSLIILHKKQKSEINSQTCDWLHDPGVWKHKISGINFCPICHFPLSSKLYCAKCSHGFGEGDACTLNDY